jgi:membrane-associated phospholipid phosphatase
VSTAVVVVLVAAVAHRRPAWVRPAIMAAAAVAVMTALGRVYVGAHWTLDTIGGTILGALCGVVTVAAILRRARPNRASRR